MSLHGKVYKLDIPSEVRRSFTLKKHARFNQTRTEDDYTVIN